MVALEYCEVTPGRYNIMVFIISGNVPINGLVPANLLTFSEAFKGK
jgi:hypothetical protein